MNENTIAIIGAGAWGTALAIAMTGTGARTVLLARRGEHAERMQHMRENADYLPGIPLPEALEISADAPVLEDADIVLAVPPAQALRASLTRLGAHIRADAPVVLCCKGIERETGLFMSQLAAEILPANPIAVLSGPTFAHEVAKGLPAAVTLATRQERLGRRLIAALGRPTFRPYYSPDVTGVEIGGAVKNVIAIACGIVMGRKLGENARAALIARGLAEVTRLGTALGARRETMMGLAGLGDLVLTCSSTASRNTSLGLALGQGKRLQDILEGRKTVSEGVWTAAALAVLAGERGIDMPITRAVNAVLHEGAAIPATIDALLSRPFRTETG